MTRKLLLAFIFFLSTTREGWSQDKPDLYGQTKDDLTLVAVAGIGGAVLGLSTLSFVDKPSDHYNNILMGAAIGIIIGVVYVAYNQAMGISPQQAAAPAIKYEIKIPEMVVSAQPEPVYMNWNFAF
jgi:hypothetical protein